MGRITGIQWASATRNFWYRCRNVSPCCAHCYGDKEVTRYGRIFSVVPRNNTTFLNPLTWRKPSLVFRCFRPDCFIEDADGWRDDAWEVRLYPGFPTNEMP